MCGIAGFLGSTENAKDVLASMVASLKHRGPDSNGTWSGESNPIHLGHTRLAIVDLAPTGAQPMVSHSGRYVVSYNGEIYNHRQIRSELASSGEVVSWRGSSDTETLVASLDAWGLKRTLDLCIGMFAIAIWDTYLQSLTLVRDRFGEKPLYYQPLSDGVIFASELSALIKHPQASQAISLEAVRELVGTQHIPAPMSIYQKVYKLLPGSVITFTQGGYESTQIYWSAIRNSLTQQDKFSGSFTDAVDELEHRLSDTINRQMMSDVPLGAFLSGGVDSSLITALMQANHTSPIKTFSIGFEQEQFDEAKYAAAVAKHIGTAHHEFYVSSQNVCDVVTDIGKIYSEPLADSSQLPTYLVSKLSRSHVTVALTGDAGDEFYAGYNRHLFTNNLWPKIRNVPVPLRRLAVSAINSLNEELLERLLSKTSMTANWTRVGEKVKRTGHVLSANDLQDLYRKTVQVGNTKHVRSEQTPSRSDADSWGPQRTLIMELEKEIQRGIQQLDAARWVMVSDQLDYLPNDILAKVDRASMAVSLETRAPFLDHTLVEFAQTLPTGFLIKGNEGKLPLRALLKRYVPDSLIERPKMGFSIPIHDYLRGPLRDWVENALSEERLSNSEVFCPSSVRRLWAEHLSGKNNHTTQLWPVLMFQSWHSEQNV